MIPTGLNFEDEFNHSSPMVLTVPVGITTSKGVKMEKALCDTCNKEVCFSLDRIRANKHSFIFCCWDCSHQHRLFNAIRKNKPSEKHPFRYIRWLKRFSYDY